MNNTTETNNQHIDTNALALAFGLNTNNMDASMTKNALDFLSSQLMNQSVDTSAALNPPQAKRKAQRKSGKSSPNQQQQPITKTQTTPNLDALASVFGNKSEEIKTDSQNDLVAANFLSSILGNTMSTPQQQQSNNDSTNNYWNENVPLKTDEVNFEMKILLLILFLDARSKHYWFTINWFTMQQLSHYKNDSLAKRSWRKANL